MHKFEVGDIVVIHNVSQEINKDLNGEEAIILSLPGSILGYPKSYGISCRKLTVTSADPSVLKPIQPPKDTREIDRVVSWDDCAWKPRQLVTNE